MSDDTFQALQRTGVAVEADRSLLEIPPPQILPDPLHGTEHLEATHDTPARIEGDVWAEQRFDGACPQESLDDVIHRCSALRVSSSITARRCASSRRLAASRASASARSRACSAASISRRSASRASAFRRAAPTSRRIDCSASLRSASRRLAASLASGHGAQTTSTAGRVRLGFSSLMSGGVLPESGRRSAVLNQPDRDKRVAVGACSLRLIARRQILAAEQVQKRMARSGARRTGCWASRR